MSVQIHPEGSKPTPYITLINHITVLPANISPLCAFVQAQLPWFAAQPGFISYAIHRTVADDEASRVVLYQQWASKADLQAMRTHPEFKDRLAGFRSFIESAQVALYDVVDVRIAE